MAPYLQWGAAMRYANVRELFMLSARGWSRLMTGVFVATALGIVGCEEENSAFEPLDDTVPPTVSISSVSNVADTLRTSVTASDFISVAVVTTEIRRTDQLEIVILPTGDTIVVGKLIVSDVTRFTGQKTTVTVDATFLVFFGQPTVVQIIAIAEDASGNLAVDSANVIVSGGGTGTGLGGPIVAITSPLAGQTVRDNTLIRVGVQATDLLGLTQLNVNLSGAITAGDTTRFSTFRTSVDTLLDFFIPPGALGLLTITAEAINTNTISGFATISVTVATVVPDDSVPPIVSMLVGGGVVRRALEPPRIEADDSISIEVIALDLESAITRSGFTVVIRNERPLIGPVVDTIFQDSVFSPAISGTVPVTFYLTPNDLPASLFTQNELPDTLFMEFTAWAFDQASPRNCGATVDPAGSSNSLQCTAGNPVHAAGISGGFVERLVVSGRTIEFPQGAIIADAAVDELRELLLLSDFEFGIVRIFDLRNEAFAANVPVGSEPWGIFIDNTLDQLLVGNSGGTNISVVSLGARITGPQPGAWREVDRFQTQDLKVYLVERKFDEFGIPIFPITVFDFSDRPQFVAQAAGGEILFSTRPAIENQQPGTIREFDPVEREIRFFISYAGRAGSPSPQIQIVNADSVFEIAGSRRFKICDHTRGTVAPAGRSCVVADSLSGGGLAVDTMNLFFGWDVLVLADLNIPGIGLQDTTFLAASGDREFIAIGEGDTPERAGRIIMYQSSNRTITNSLQVSDLTGNAAQKVFGLALNNDGSVGVGRGEVAFFFGPDSPGGPNVLRLMGTNNNISPTGTGAALHPDHDQNSQFVEAERLAFLGSGDARIEMVDTHFFEFSRGDILIRDPVIGPLRVTRPLPTDPPEVALRLYGVTANGVVVIPVRFSEIDPIP